MIIYSLTGDIPNCKINTAEKKIIKEYLPEYNSEIFVKNTNIKLFNSKSDLTFESEGMVKVNDNFDTFKIKEKYNYKDKSFDINGTLGLTNSVVKVSKLNYSKNSLEDSEIDFDISFTFKKKYHIKKLNLLAGKNKILLSNIELNESFEVDDFKKLEVKTFTNEINNNDFAINKNKKIIISGKVFDAQH